MRAVLAFTLALSAAPVAASDLIGTVMPPYPEGLTSDMGACIADPAGEDVCAFSISTLNNAEGDVVAIVASRFSHHDTDGAPFWETLDVRTPPAIEDGQIWAMELCYVDGDPDGGTVGIVTYRDAGGWIEAEDTIWATRFDIETGRLTKLDPKRVACELPGS